MKKTNFKMEKNSLTREKSKFNIKKFILIIMTVTFAVSLLTLCGGLIAYASITNNAKIDNTLLPQSTVNAVFLDNSHNVIEGTSNDFVSYDELPENLINAVIALEDKRYYKHHGVDTIRLVGAALNNLKTRSFSEGGSTITQQLIKNTHLSQDKTIKRKLIEIKLAKKLEREYSKEDILTMYMNIVYFGNGIYGVKNAAKGIFNKSLSALTLPECATLAAVLKNPSKYSPIINPANSLARRNLVLELMHKQNYIGNDEYNEAVSNATVIDKSAIYSNTQSYMLSAAYEAANILNISVQTLMSSNYVIETYMDASCQQSLTDVIGNPSYYVLNENKVRGEGIGIIVDNETAGVSGYFCTKKRNIYDFSRPYGSVAKPVLVYAPALQYNLITAATPVLDEKTDFSGYMPQNFNDTYRGWIDIRTAISVSSNVCAVKTYNAVGYDKAKNFAASIDIDLSSDANNATVALGNLSYGNNFLDILGGYCAFSCGGAYKAPTFIKSIQNADGSLIYSDTAEKTNIMSADNAYIMTDMLIETVKNGTARGLQGLNFDIAAKTGTVGDENSNTDAYNIGYTSKHSFLVWHGNSTGDNAGDLPLAETGGSYVTRSARDIMQSIYESNIPENFAVPDTIVYKDIDGYCQLNMQSVKLATENTPYEYIKTELFSSDNNPTENSTCFDSFSVQGVSTSVNDGIINIGFDNQSYLYYDILRYDDSGAHIIKTYKPTDDQITFSDIGAPYNTRIKYYIKPYFYNQNKEKIDGIQYETAEFYLKNDYNSYDVD